MSGFMDGVGHWVKKNQLAAKVLEQQSRIEQLERELRVYMDAAEGHMVERMRLTDQLAAEKALADEYASSFSIGKHGGVIMRPAKVKAADDAYRKARGL